MLGNKFIVGGDFNAKHPWWGSRLINPKGRELYKCINKNHYTTLSTGSPTYWPSDPNKLPDLLDFFVYSGIAPHLLDIKHCDDLSSDHTPIILFYDANISQNIPNYKVIRPTTDIESFKYWIDKHIDFDIAIKTPEELEDAVESFTQLIHEAAQLSTSMNKNGNKGKKVVVSAEIREMIAVKRRLRKVWHHTRHPSDKSNFNKACRDVKTRLAEFKNEATSSFLKSLGYTQEEDFRLWKATKYLKRPTRKKTPIKSPNGNWCCTDSEKISVFVSHLQETFKPYTLNNDADKFEVQNFLDAPNQMALPIKRIHISEVQSVILKLNKAKCPGYDKIDALVLKSLSDNSLKYLTLLYNSVVRISHFPSQWKCAEIILVPKPNKPASSASSYRPISLLSTFSKVFERILLSRLTPILEKRKIIPEHQFGFRQKHGTPEQCHRVVEVVRNCLELKQYCCGVFLDIQQAFDKVWHPGLLYKIKKLVPSPFYMLIRSYLENRSFYIKIGSETSTQYDIKSGVPQGSVIGPLLYTIYCADMPLQSNVTCATYADDTAFLTTNYCPVEASNQMQITLNLVQKWLTKWNIKINPQKSVHITFTLRRGDCPELLLNDVIIPKQTSVRYLGFKLDKRLTWREHIKAKHIQLKQKTKKLYWLLNPKSELSLNNKLMLYKAILKPVWTYGIQLWGTTSVSNLEILQRYQSKTLRLICNAPWFVTNKSLHRDLKMMTVNEEIKKISNKYLQRLSNHENPLAIALLDDQMEIRRLKRYNVLDLPYRN